MHLKLNGLGDGELPDFMMWSGVTELPWWWSMFKSGFVSIVSVFLLPGLIAAAFAWLMFRRRIGGVYFALITQALALAFATLLISQQGTTGRSEEHTSELQSLMRTSYAVFCLTQKTQNKTNL